MKIFLDDGMQIEIGTGIGRYSKCLLSELQKRNDIEVVNSSYKRKEVASSSIERLRYLIHINSKSFANELLNYDIAHFTNFAMPFHKNKKTKYVVTVHDLTAFLYPQTLPTWYRIYNQWMIKNSIQHADMIITVSESVKKEIIQLFPKARKKVVVIYPGVEEQLQEANASYSADNLKVLRENKFFLFVGTVEKRKNISIVLEAFIRLKDTNPNSVDFKLVLAGRPGYGFDEFCAMAAKSKWVDDILFAGYISNGDRNLLYKSAAAFVFPSVYEGFGIPQVECMRFHLPIILSDIPTNREISKEYGNYFQLGNVDSLVDSMCIFINKKYEYAARAKLADQYLQKFVWSEIAQKHCIVYQEANKRQQFLKG